MGEGFVEIFLGAPSFPDLLKEDHEFVLEIDVHLVWSVSVDAVLRAVHAHGAVGFGEHLEVEKVDGVGHAEKQDDKNCDFDYPIK